MTRFTQNSGYVNYKRAASGAEPLPSGAGQCKWPNCQCVMPDHCPEYVSAMAADAKDVNVETKTYADGTTATGVAPLPAQSPAQREDRVMGMVEDYGQWLWDAGYMDNPRGEHLVDDATERRKEIRTAIDALQTAAYAEGRKDERENLERIGATHDCPSCGGRGERMVSMGYGPDVYQDLIDCPDCNGTGYECRKANALPEKPPAP